MSVEDLWVSRGALGPPVVRVDSETLDYGVSGETTEDLSVDDCTIARSGSATTGPSPV